MNGKYSNESDIKKQSNPSDHLANERTFLAWIRTSIALMGFGFVIVKFALFIREVSIALGDKISTPPKGYSAIIGVVMVAFGAIPPLKFHPIQLSNVLCCLNIFQSFL